MKKLVLLSFLLTSFNLSYSQVGNSPYPIIFVHGTNGGDYSWNDILNFLQNTYSISGQNRFHAVLNARGGDTTYYLDDVIVPEKNDNGGAENHLSNTNVYAINFDNFWNRDNSDPRLLIYSDHTPGINQSRSNQSAIYKQGFALKQCIQKVLDTTKAEKVILVGHSMGGLAIREYLQRVENDSHKWWIDPSDIVNGHKVAKVVTIGTPHLGTNVSTWFPEIVGIDGKCEAVRDMRYSFTDIFNFFKGPYLFSGSEENIPDNTYYNRDVDCNGAATIYVSGLNYDSTFSLENPLPSNISYTWITSEFLGLNGDIIVDLDKQWLHYNNIPMPANISDTLKTNKSHGHETEDIHTILRGLDEPDNLTFAYTLQFNKTYSGFITSQMYGNALDNDYYRVTVSEAVNLTVTINGGSTSGLTGIAVLSNTGNIISTTSVSNSSQVMSCSVNSGDYFIRVRGIADQNPNFNSYRLKVEFAPNTQWQRDIWLVNIPMPWGGGSGYTSLSKSIAAEGNLVHVVWHDFRNFTWEVYYKRSTDGGLNWEPDVRLTNNAGQSDNASIFAKGSDVFVVWHDNSDGNFEIYYKCSTDGGTSWGSDIRLTNDNSSSFHPSIFVYGSTIHVIWHDYRDGNSEIYYKRSTNKGVTWEADKRISDGLGSSEFASIAASGANINVAWRDNRRGNFEIYFKLSSNEGIDWNPEERLTDNIGNSNYPCLASSGLNLSLVWEDNRYSNSRIFYRRSTNGGISWEAEIQLSNTENINFRPTIVSSGSNLHLAWYGIYSQWQLYYKYSSNSGLTWGDDTYLTTPMFGVWSMSTLPSLAASGNAVHLAWTDYAHIFYKGHPTQNISHVNFEVNLGMAIEGLKNLTGNNLRDTIRLYVRNSTSPYSIIDSAKGVLDSITSQVNLSLIGNNIQNNIPYYIAIKHRNSVETWNSIPQSFSGNSISYDFKSSSSQAYGNNMVQIGITWCLYSGDVNQNGMIDLTDLILIYNDVSNFSSGYLGTDLNGDAYTDLADLLFAFNNSVKFVSKITP